MELYFSRHGKTQWNQEMRFQGREGDSPLLPESVQEIKLLGERLTDIPFKKIYSSPSKRARETAKGIQAELREPVEIVYYDGLKEIGLGELEGQKIAEARIRYSEMLDALRYHPDQYHPETFGGELYQEMLKRSMQVVREAVTEETEGPLLFIGHGVTLTGCIQALTGKPLNQLREMGGLHNSSLSILEVPKGMKEGPYNLLLWDDQAHLSTN